MPEDKEIKVPRKIEMIQGRVTSECYSIFVDGTAVAFISEDTKRMVVSKKWLDSVGMEVYVGQNGFESATKI